MSSEMNAGEDAANNSACSDEFIWNGKVVLIGASTGGVEALETILQDFPVNCPPTLICQHMPAAFLKSFCSRLQQNMSPKMHLVTTEHELLQGHIYLAAGNGSHLKMSPDGTHKCFAATGAKVNGHHPSVDVLFKSALVHGRDCVAAILTGMGRDGAKGLLALRQSGCTTIGQDEKTSVVYGMPWAAKRNGAVMHECALDQIAGKILDTCSIKQRGRA